MKIGLDFGGIMDYDESGWALTLKKLISEGHEVHIVSHALPGKDELRRKKMCDLSGAINYTFSHTMDENTIRRLKAEYVRNKGIELFVDDSSLRCEAVRKLNPEVALISTHHLHWSFCKKLFDNFPL